MSVLGTDISTITDVDGRFILKEIPEKAQRIRVKYIGMQPKDVKIRPIMNVTLDLEKKLAFFIQAGVGVSGYNLENNNEDIYGGNNHLYIQGGVGLNYNFSTYFSLRLLSMWWPKVVRTWAEEAPMAKEKSLSTLYIWKSLS